MRGTGTSTALGEAQSKEFQPLGTFDVFCTHFAFSGLSIYKRVGVGDYWRVVGGGVGVILRSNS